MFKSPVNGKAKEFVYRWRDGAKRAAAGSWRGLGRKPALRAPVPRVTALDDYVVSTLSSYRDTTFTELIDALRNDYGYVSARHLYARLKLAIERGQIVKLANEDDETIYRRVRRT